MEWRMYGPVRQTKESVNAQFPILNSHPMGIENWELSINGFLSYLTGIANMNRLLLAVTFFHCVGFPGNGPFSLNKSFGVPAWKVGVIVTSTAMTSQSRVM